jgi:hypothetical protein
MLNGQNKRILEGLPERWLKECLEVALFPDARAVFEGPPDCSSGGPGRQVRPGAYWAPDQSPKTAWSHLASLERHRLLHCKSIYKPSCY